MKTSNSKTILVAFSGMGLLSLFILGFYNTALVNQDPFKSQDKVSFIKRLDEMTGKIKVGRLAASASAWVNLQKEEIKNEVKKEEKILKVEKKVVVNNIPAPAINEKLDLKLSRAFFREPLAEGTFEGHAKAVAGVIEEVFVTLPTGQVINIRTKEKMVGNVFTYEDSYTREPRSGMFYEVKKGIYMISLTNDTQFAGTRLEFIAENNDSENYENIRWGVTEETQDYAARDLEMPTKEATTSYGFNFNS